VQTYWFYRHRWIAGKPFLNRLLVASTVVLTVFLVLVDIHPARMDNVSQACVFNTLFTVIGALFSASILCASIIIGTLIRHSRDVYRMKAEIGAVAVVWAISLLGSYLFNELETDHMRLLVPGGIIFFLFGQIATFVVSNLLPLAYAYQYDNSNGEKEGTIEDFATKLQSLDFRNHFHDFLTKQFCQENLQFYEVVQEWKLMNPNDPHLDKTESAKMIVQNFIEEGAVCQVNIEGDLRTAITAKVREAGDGGGIHGDIFDTAVEALVYDMHVNSYRLFMASSQYKMLLTDMT